jgi:hypothetical protein
MMFLCCPKDDWLTFIEDYMPGEPICCDWCRTDYVATFRPAWLQNGVN